MTGLKTRLIVLQPTTFCNINCSYCYLAERSRPQVMSRETVASVVRFLFSAPERLHTDLEIIWHAGEPLVASSEFYADAFAQIADAAPSSTRISHSLQTNATLIDESWCSLFREWKVNVGVSLDGPEIVHDKYRLDRRGQGTFRRTLEGIRCLRANHISFETISVITKASLEHVDEIWSLLCEIRPRSIGFVAEETQGEHVSVFPWFDESGKASHVGLFFARLYELWERDARPFRIRELEDTRDAVMNLSRQRRNIENLPLSILNITWDGKVSSFSPELLGATHKELGDLAFGDVRRDTLETIARSSALKTIYREIVSGVQMCQQTCAHFSLCGGGAPSAKLFANGTFNSSETASCRLRVKAIGMASLAQLERQTGLDGSSGLPLSCRFEALASRLEMTHNRANARMPG